MKLRTALITTLITALLFLGLAACSLVEDVTPPAGYVAPTVHITDLPFQPTSTSRPPTTTSEPPATETLAAATGTSISTEAGSMSATPEVETTPEAGSITPESSGTAPVQTGSVSGTIISGSGGEIPAALTVTLRGFDMPADQSSNPTESINLPGTVQPDGSRNEDGQGPA